jgi:chromosomal replication initiator protein
LDRHQIEVIWSEALAVVATSINTGSFRIWFEPTVGLEFSNDTFVVGVPSLFAKDWIETRFSSVIKEALAAVLGGPVTVRLAVSDEVPRRLDAQNVTVAAVPLLLQAEEDTPSSPAAEPYRGYPPRPPRFNGGPPRLNPKYTFESFVIGPSNRFAHAAALATAETPGTNYNPLFVYGGVGLGKTHLLQAIGQYVTRHQPALTVQFVTIETFTNDFINSLRDDSIEGFKSRYRQNDVLLIDDIQFLENKEQTQEEFFHTFNSLYEAGKQIVISSDRPPRALRTLEDRLRSRFESGLTVDIQPPDLETRIAILRKKVQLEGIDLADEEVLAQIASRVPTNIRELEGCLTRIVAFSSFTKRPIDVDMAREVLKDIPEIAGTRITIDLILNSVTSTTGISIAEIKGDKRTRPVVQSRHLAMYLARELTDTSLPKIGERFGGRDHTTVMHGVKSIAKQMAEDRDIYNLVQQLTTRIKSAR